MHENVRLGLLYLSTMNLEWHIHDWASLPKEDLHDILALRVNIFVVEQDCPYPEIDGKDRQSWHLYAKEGVTLAGYLRIVEAGVAYDELAIGRVVVDERFRGKALGHLLMERAMRFIEEKWGPQSVRLGAQDHLRGYYGAHGFKVASDMYLEDGIPHVEMLFTPKTDET